MKLKAGSGSGMLASSLAIGAAGLALVLVLGGCQAIIDEFFAWDVPARPTAAPAFIPEPRPARGWPAGTPHVTTVGRNAFSGQPDEAGFAYAAAQGVETVVNVREESEMAELGFDERALVESLGMKYVHIPIPILAGADPTHVFRDAADHVSDPTRVGVVKPRCLIHDATGDRVGAVWAYYAAYHYGRHGEAAIKTGRKAGLHSEAMIAEVRLAVAPFGE